MNVQINGATTASAPHIKPDWLMLIARGRNTVLKAALITAILFLGLTFVIPQNYQSTATVLPPERQGVGGMLSSLLSSNSAALDLLKGGASDNPTLDLFKTIVESRSVAEEVARDPNVLAFFSRNDTAISTIPHILQESIQSEALRTGEFTLTVELSTPMLPSKRDGDSTKLMAAYVANKFITELDRFNRVRLLTIARNTRIFVEQEYNERMVQLDSAYRQLQVFQEAHQAISLPEQLTATVTAAAKLTSQIQQLEMQIGVEERELGPNSPRMQALYAELTAAKEELQKYDDGGAGEYILALKNVPELSRQFAHYLREVKVLEQVSAYLRQELEQDRVSEQRDLPSLQVLDSAQPPKKRAWPNRTLFTLVGLILGLAIGVGNISYKSFRQDVRERPEAHYRLVNLMATLRNGRKAKPLLPLTPQNTDPASVEKILHREQKV